ncbi:unnamed protein product [Didymodactylos carnosus]|uniref:Uncharacterized protein n=1 Tax=Didymodactylos carnosus TaxID=1234261 RepID=A0A813YYE7_9BILA|nr:unnamed protein product [Didymodactylos carnosus]CAF3675656.1 unnamed protein product [Didymodactylos carnosus]
MEHYSHLPNCPNRNSPTLWVIKTACSCQSAVPLSPRQSPQKQTTQSQLPTTMLPPKQPKTIQQKAVLHAAATKAKTLPELSHPLQRRNSADCASQEQQPQAYREEEKRRSSLSNSLPPILEHSSENNNRLSPPISPSQGQRSAGTVFPPEAIFSIYEQRYSQAQQQLQLELHRPSGFLNIESISNHRQHDTNRITQLIQYPYASYQQECSTPPSSPQQQRKHQHHLISTQVVRQLIFYNALPSVTN